MISVARKWKVESNKNRNKKCPSNLITRALIKDQFKYGML
jgi:hypothetical protein